MFSLIRLAHNPHRRVQEPIQRQTKNKMEIRNSQNGCLTSRNETVPPVTISGTENWTPPLGGKKIPIYPKSWNPQNLRRILVPTPAERERKSERSWKTKLWAHLGTLLYPVNLLLLPLLLHLLPGKLPLPTKPYFPILFLLVIAFQLTMNAFSC